MWVSLIFGSVLVINQGGKIVVTANTGDANNGYEGTATTNLPISFPTSELLAVGTVRDISGWNLKEIMTIGSLTKTQISVLMQCKISTEMVGFWVVLGY